MTQGTPVPWSPGVQGLLYVTGECPSDGRYEWFARRYGLQLRGTL